MISGLEAPALAQADGDPGPGVVVAPVGLISDALQLAVANVLATVPPDKRLAFVAVATERGVNLAVAYRAGPHMVVAAWLGKSGWDKPLGRGVALQAVF
jgi:hypothetical protein